MQPSEIKVEMAFAGSKGNPLNSYIREKALSLSVSLTHKNTHHISTESHAYAYTTNNSAHAHT